LSDKNVDITKQLQKIGQTVNDYRDVLMSHFKDMDVEIKNWNFAVGKLEKEYTVEVNVKLGLKPKKS